MNGFHGAELTLTPVPRRRLAEEVGQQLLAAIGDLPPGTRIPTERELMEAFGVGRSTVREALKGLAMLGVVEIRHGQGVFAAARDATPLPAAIGAALTKGITHDLLEARLVVETALARLSAERRTDADLAEIRATVDEQTAAVAADRDPADASIRFHLAVADAAHNGILSAVVRAFADLIGERLPAVYAADPNFQQWELEEHRGILAALADGAADAAAERTSRHIRAMEAHYKRAGSA